MDIDNDRSARPDDDLAQLPEDDYGTDIELDEELERVLYRAESQVLQLPPPTLSDPFLVPPTLAVERDEEIDVADIVDLEDVTGSLQSSPFELFRPKGRLSVSDLVGLVWCEMQYDYRLRTLPHLPPHKRPTVITTRTGEQISVDKVKVEGKEKVLKRGQKIHKRLEKEIHPQEIVVRSETKEDVWGLRFLNMFAAIEALLTIGKCRELPVIGLVGGTLVMGVIDEIVREPIPVPKTSKAKKEPDKTQTSLTSFFSPTKPKTSTGPLTRASDSIPREADTLAGRLQLMLYKEILDAILLAEPIPEQDIETPPIVVSDSAILPTEVPFAWSTIFSHLGVQLDQPFSDHFLHESAPIVVGNELRFNVDKARTLRDMVRSWEQYVSILGLGTPIRNASRLKVLSVEEKNRGKTDDRLELVYRRAGSKKLKGDASASTRALETRPATLKGAALDQASTLHNSTLSEAEQLEEMLIQEALNESLRDGNQTSYMANAELDMSTYMRSASSSFGDDVDQADHIGDETIDEGLAWAAEVSFGIHQDEPILNDAKETVLRGSQSVASQSQNTPSSSPSSSSSSSPVIDKRRLPVHASVDSAATATSQSSFNRRGSSQGTSKAGSIIGKSVFTHSPRQLAIHLASTLQWWMGEREPKGVSVHETRRCGWCEFEEGCEWRAKKAEEALSNARSRLGR
ncbi:exonuclease V [Kockovaella imperatae]|uniref:Exonuclease V n=1 Tax=Kockovaella imperatae TaxID=4999 RepID=A0A1Y1UJZ2_9TREE|nr:exonuclease V [Kockovaella imperatae]ORX37445.1 exonuclease V [Kockovaella imperatae]